MFYKHSTWIVLHYFIKNLKYVDDVVIIRELIKHKSQGDLKISWII